MPKNCFLSKIIDKRNFIYIFIKLRHLKLYFLTYQIILPDCLFRKKEGGLKQAVCQNIDQKKKQFLDKRF
jgi:hypothetical protein